MEQSSVVHKMHQFERYFQILPFLILLLNHFLFTFILPFSFQPRWHFWKVSFLWCKESQTMIPRYIIAETTRKADTSWSWRFMIVTLLDHDASWLWSFMIVTLHDCDASWLWRIMIVTLHDCDALKIDFKRTWWLCWHIYYLDELTCYNLGGCPGLVVMGDNSWSRGRGFESRHCILDGIEIFHIDVCLQRPKINEKEAGVGPFLKTCTNFVYFANLDLRLFNHDQQSWSRSKVSTINTGGLFMTTV